MDHISRSPEQTIALGQQFSRRLRGGSTVCLIGDLGAGKTQFMKGIALGLGITRTITSPTFVLLKQYPVPDSEPSLTLNHLDLYRVDGDLEALGFGFEDLLTDDQITCIEWADRLTSILPEDAVEIIFTYIDDTTRSISIPN
ncbi:tRNA (adenosine(37)-N6)-threonylcarbamoyltransferase complex ATPase subunit type 1 TsaE [Candidatus Wirthbacteria bacterium CG2_30_54_11]|uniref:tRNA threonylcarbamoyladenosine biosynthesis protein TsaE n=1 Tax=Candidatus Wirthbacteria bacterium CG2_30_54_11 TaxID=1817892 RepID=A0A1J5IDR9_9BACT|nr:MAG: tRNA (adenosine(37)-N6)-threonylcarbamoyltransferase complex ATPase subunit type 1 TsaE [Candidatus Wirthbacteria bacterium CG2_30_54_11]